MGADDFDDLEWREHEPALPPTWTCWEVGAPCWHNCDDGLCDCQTCWSWQRLGLIADRTCIVCTGTGYIQERVV